VLRLTVRTWAIARSGGHVAGRQVTAFDGARNRCGDAPIQRSRLDGPAAENVEDFIRALRPISPRSFIRSRADLVVVSVSSVLCRFRGMGMAVRPACLFCRLLSPLVVSGWMVNLRGRAVFDLG
jgi:hypothetical protein